MGIELNTIITSILCLVVAITLHEFAHSLVGYWLGDDTAQRNGRLNLNPLSHIDPFYTIALPLVMVFLNGPILAAAKPVPYNPHRLRWGRWGAALVAVAGPLTNMLIACVVGLLVRFVAMPEAFQNLALYMIVINVGLGIFNLIPFPPLDGSRVLYAAIPSLRKSIDWIESQGMLVFFAIFFFGYQFIAPIVNNAVGLVVGLILGSSMLP